MTLPRVQALAAYWRFFPPAHLQLARIATFAGMKQPDRTPPVRDPAEAAKAFNMALVEGRPDDPMLALLD